MVYIPPNLLNTCQSVFLCKSGIFTIILCQDHTVSFVRSLFNSHKLWLCWMAADAPLSGIDYSLFKKHKMVQLNIRWVWSLTEDQVSVLYNIVNFFLTHPVQILVFFSLSHCILVLSVKSITYSLKPVVDIYSKYLRLQLCPNDCCVHIHCWIYTVCGINHIP